MLYLLLWSLVRHWTLSLCRTRLEFSTAGVLLRWLCLELVPVLIPVLLCRRAAIPTRTGLLLLVRVSSQGRVAQGVVLSVLSFEVSF